jgi:CRP-like cAMP-binding protein
MVQKQSNGHLQNRLLAALPPQAFSLFESGLRASTFKQGAIVQEVGELVDQIYFPQTGMISLLVVTQEGVGIEAASIGREGAVGLHRGLGKRRSFTRAVIQVSGTISHISADVFERAVGQSDAIKDMITHYTEVLWVEAQQIAACNAVHSVEARFARWLLQTQDRVDSDSLPLTQEFCPRCSEYAGQPSRSSPERFKRPGLSGIGAARLLSLTEQASKKPLASVTKSSTMKPFPKSSASSSRLPSVRFAA